MKQRVSLPPARTAALKALAQILPTAESNDTEQSIGMDVQAALDQVLTSSKLDPRDAGLTTELVYGYLRLMARIKAILSGFLKAPEKLPGELHLILGLAGYEILFLDRVPTYASVNWAVDAVRSRINPKLSGLANAVLRRVGDLGNEVHEKSFYGKDETPRTLAKFYSCPQWIIQLWLTAYGPERTENYLRAQVMPPALGVIVPEDHPDRDQSAAALAEHPGLLDASGLGFVFPAGTQLTPFAGDQPLLRGSFAARQALLALKPEAWDEPIWDACCGRGGKTRVLRELGKKVQASDPHIGRIRALKKEQPDVEAKVYSALEGFPFADQPATILLDAPCSGLGVLSRRPDTKWRRFEVDLAELIELQAELLDAAAANVQPGGTIAYITCTLNPAENEKQVQAFLTRHPSFELAIEWTTPPASPLKEFFYVATLRPAAG